MNCLKQSVALGLFSVLVAANPLSTEGAVAFDFTPGGQTLTGNQIGGPYSLGTVFTVNQAINVTGLRVFDNGMNGIGGINGVEVAIYVLNSFTILDPANPATWDSGFSQASHVFQSTDETADAATGTRYATASATLSPGTYLIVANRMGDTAAGASEQNYNYGTAAPGNQYSITTDTGGGLVTYGRSVFSDTEVSGFFFSGLWQLDPSTASPNYAAGNFDFTAVPEAEHFALAGVGLLGLVYFGRCAFLRRAARA
jgi:hypothetical protein